jgi:hypothetical protein
LSCGRLASRIVSIGKRGLAKAGSSCTRVAGFFRRSTVAATPPSSVSGGSVIMAMIVLP